MTYADAMRDYGNDKPDTRFEMKFVDLTSTVKGQGFPVFDQRRNWCSASTPLPAPPTPASKSTS